MKLELELEKIASDLFLTPAEKEAFVDGFLTEAVDGLEKAANIWTEGIRPAGEATKSIWSHLGTEAVKGGGKALGMLGVGLLSAALAKGINTVASNNASVMQRQKFESALANVLATSKICKQDPARAKSFAESLFRVAPNIIGDTNLLRNVLDSIVQGESVDVNTIKMLTDLEDRYTGNQLPAQFARIG